MKKNIFQAHITWDSAKIADSTKHGGTDANVLGNK